MHTHPIVISQIESYFQTSFPKLMNGSENEIDYPNIYWIVLPFDISTMDQILEPVDWQKLVDNLIHNFLTGL
jgi:hypothetical protein